MIWILLQVLPLPFFDASDGPLQHFGTSFIVFEANKKNTCFFLSFSSLESESPSPARSAPSSSSVLGVPGGSVLTCPPPRRCHAWPREEPSSAVRTSLPSSRPQPNIIDSEKATSGGFDFRQLLRPAGHAPTESLRLKRGWRSRPELTSDGCDVWPETRSRRMREEVWNVALFIFNRRCEDVRQDLCRYNLYNRWLKIRLVNICAIDSNCSRLVDTSSNFIRRNARSRDWALEIRYFLSARFESYGSRCTNLAPPNPSARHAVGILPAHTEWEWLESSAQSFTSVMKIRKCAMILALRMNVQTGI